MAQLTERERAHLQSPHCPLCPSLPPSRSLPSPPFFLPASHFSFSTLSGWHGPQPHVGISYSDHFQLMSSFISREQSNSGRMGSSEREASSQPHSATFFIFRAGFFTYTAKTFQDQTLSECFKVKVCRQV